MTVPKDGVYHRMVMRAWLTIAVTLAASAAAPQATPAVEDDRLDPSLSSRLRRIEAAFRESDANALRPSLPVAGKVRVDLPDLREGQGSYGPGQLRVVLARIFQESPTREFTFGKDGVTAAPGTAFARGRWVRRTGPRGQESASTLTFTLREESGDWRISEIRSSR